MARCWYQPIWHTYIKYNIHQTTSSMISSSVISTKVGLKIINQFWNHHIKVDSSLKEFTRHQTWLLKKKTLPETNIATEIWPSQNEISSSKNWCSEVMLVLGREKFLPFPPFICSCSPCRWLTCWPRSNMWTTPWSIRIPCRISLNTSEQKSWWNPTNLLKSKKRTLNYMNILFKTNILLFMPSIVMLLSTKTDSWQSTVPRCWFFQSFQGRRPRNSRGLVHVLFQDLGVWQNSATPSWWFQPIWKIFVNLGIFPK